MGRNRILFKSILIRKASIVISILFILIINTNVCFSNTDKPYIQFFGAAQMVGGSCYLIDTGKSRALIDFGLFYGSEYEGLNVKIPFDPKTIDYVFLTHAHIDHSGRIPLLYKKGFNGKVLGTDATKTILGIMLEMSLGISQEQGNAFYSFDDYFKTMDNYMVVPYNKIINLSEDLSFCFRDAGHILGSSIIEIWIKTKYGKIKIVTTGDMGSKSTPLLRDPAIIEDGDYILVESTYGAVTRGEPDYEIFGKEIQKTISAGGSVLIPAFVLEKTQKVIYVIGRLKEKGLISKNVPVYVDSSTGKDINKVYRKYKHYYDKEALEILETSGDPLSYPSLYEVSAKDSLETHSGKTPAIYIASSGMLDHANAPKHLLRMIEDRRNLLAIIGWQAPDSLGRKLQEGATWVTIPIEERIKGSTKITYEKKPVKMKVMTFGIFSSHADGCGILKWLSNYSKTKKIFVVHGEKMSSEKLAKAIENRVGFKAIVPKLNDKYTFSERDDYYDVQKRSGLCEDLDNTQILGGKSDE